MPEELSLLLRAFLPEDLERSFRHDPRWRSATAVEIATEHLALVRYCNPERSIALAEALLGNVAQSGDRDLFVAVARALIESHRLGGWLSTAVQLGRWMVGSALATGDRVRVDTYLTAFDLLASKAKYEPALSVATSAVELAARCDAVTGFTAQVTLARSLLLKEQADEWTYCRCMDSMERAAGASWRQKFAAHDFAVAWLTAQKRYPEASWHLQTMRSLLPEDLPYPEGSLLKAESGLAQQRGDLEFAAATASRAMECFSEINPFDTAIVSLDLIEVQLERGRAQAAMEVAAQVKKLLMAHETNQIAEAALVELSKIEAVSELSARLAKIRQLLTEGRRQGLRPRS